MSDKKKLKKSAAARALRNKNGKRPTTSGPSGRDGQGDAPGPGEKQRGSVKEPTPTVDGEAGPRKGLHGVPGSKNDSRRCTATAHRTGERCRAPAIKGGTVCRVHGGAAPQVKKAARERLLDLVDPAIGQLARLLNRDDVDDGVRLRAITSLLDRCGFGPGQHVTLHASKWDELVEGAGGSIIIDRSLPPAEHPALDVGGGDDDDTTVWIEEPAPANYALGEVVPGEVVVARHHRPPDQGPTDPPRYFDEEAWEADHPTRTTRIER